MTGRSPSGRATHEPGLASRPGHSVSVPNASPAPWVLKTHHRYGHDRMVETWYVEAPNGVGIAVQPAFSCDDHAEANFRLIAAAPQLFAALMEAIPALMEAAIRAEERWDDMYTHASNPLRVSLLRDVEEAKANLENARSVLIAAQAIEARRAETLQDGSVHESAVPTGCAQDKPTSPFKSEGNSI